MSNDSEVLISRRPRRATYTFGPGSLESITTTTWTTKHGVGRIRTRGTFMVYCGRGGVHSTRIDITGDASDYLGDTVDEATGTLVMDALDNWSDPCS